MPIRRVLLIGAALITALCVAVVAAGYFIDDREHGAAADEDQPDWTQPVGGWPYSIAADDELAVVVADVVTALDAVDGRVRWEADVPGAWLHRPAISEQTVLVSADDRFVALERTSGTERWTYDAAQAGPVALGTEATGAEVALLASENGALGALDADTGRRRWSIQHTGELWGPSVADPEAGVAAAVWSGFDEPRLRVFDLTTGAIEWEVPVDPYVAPPLMIDGAVVVAEGDGNFSGRATAYALTDGEAVWSVPLPASFQTGTQPAADGGQVAVVDRLGTVTVLDDQSGTTVWQAELRRPVLHTRVVLTSDAVVVTDEPGEVVILDRADGEIRERIRPDGYPVGITNAGDRLLVALRLTEPGRVEAWPGL